MKKYKNLTRKELHRFFKDDIFNYVFDMEEEISEDEAMIAELFERQFGVKLKHFPRVNYPEGIHTPDFGSTDGIILEIKSTSSFNNGFDNRFKQFNKQIVNLSDNVKKIVAIKIDEISGYSDEKIIEKALERAKFHKVECFTLIKNGCILYIDNL